MINRNLLRAAWTACGKTQSDAAKLLNISDKTMTQRMSKGVFGSDEISKMIAEYHIEDPMSVFFADAVS